MKKMQQVTFEIDALAKETVNGIATFDGVKYEVIVTPAERLEKVRKLDDKTAGREPAISLGPRGGGCPCCGR